jgi:hypothetical protein
MARRYDPFDEEYEGGTPEPFGQMAQGYEQEQAQLREQRRLRDLALSQPVAPDPATTYTPDYTPEIIAPGGISGLPIGGSSVLAMRPCIIILLSLLLLLRLLLAQLYHLLQPLGWVFHPLPLI